MFIERTGIQTPWAEKIKTDLDRVRALLLEQPAGPGGVPEPSASADWRAQRPNAASCRRPSRPVRARTANRPTEPAAAPDASRRSPPACGRSAPRAPLKVGPIASRSYFGRLLA